MPSRTSIEFSVGCSIGCGSPTVNSDRKSARSSIRVKIEGAENPDAAANGVQARGELGHGPQAADAAESKLGEIDRHEPRPAFGEGDQCPAERGNAQRVELAV